MTPQPLLSYRPRCQSLLMALMGTLLLALMLGGLPAAQAQKPGRPQAESRDIQEINRLMKQGQSAQALERVDKLIAAQADDARARFLRGVILTDLKRTDEAVATFVKLNEEFPELPEPYNNLAVIYAQQRQYDKARTALDAAIRANPRYAVAHENLGDIYLRMAGQEYDKALQVDKASASSQKKLAAVRELLAAPTAR